MVKYTNHKFRCLNHFYMYGSVAFSTVSWLYNHPQHPTQNVFIFPTWNSVPIKQRPLYPPPAQPLQSTLLLPVSRKLPALCTSPKWDPTARVLLCLVYFTEHHVPQVRRGCSPRRDFLLFLRLNIMHCTDGVHFVYLFIWSMDVELPLLFSCCAFVTSAFVNAGVQTQSGFSQYV